MAEKGTTAQIFGKSYPLYRDENCVSFENWLPDFFAQQEKKFTAEDYYAEMVKNHPEYKKKWYERLPSEKDIEKYFLKEYGFAAMDGANSVTKAERDLGVKIGGGYKYPKGMTDIEYHATYFQEDGFASPFRDNMRVTNKKEAYMEAWQNLHYDKSTYLERLQHRYDELVELNPQLKSIKLDKENKEQLTYLVAGVTYNFPMADIQLFINGARAASEKDREQADLKAAGIDYKFQWVLSSETIRDIGQKLREKEGKTQQKEVIVKEEVVEKTPKEKVADKLKSWGIEDGSYMLLSKEDNVYTLYGTNEVRRADSYFDSGAKDIEKSGRDIVYGTNNGLIGAYFAEGVYVVSANQKLANVLYYKGENNGFGVMLSNGEDFRHADGTRDEKLNHQWNVVSRKGKEATISEMRQGRNPAIIEPKTPHRTESSPQKIDNSILRNRTLNNLGK